MSKTSGLCCFTGYTAKDANYSSVDSKFTQLMRTKIGCKVADVVNALDLRADTINAQNVIVNNSLLLHFSPLGTFTFDNNVQGHTMFGTGVWEAFSSTELPFITDMSQGGITVMGSIVTVAMPGFYTVTLNADAIGGSANYSLGWGINGAEPSLAFTTVLATVDTVVNDSTVLFLNAGDTVQLFTIGTIADTALLSRARLVLSNRGI